MFIQDDVRANLKTPKILQKVATASSPLECGLDLVEHGGTGSVCLGHNRQSGFLVAFSWVIHYPCREDTGTPPERPGW